MEMSGDNAWLPAWVVRRISAALLVVALAAAFLALASYYLAAHDGVHRACMDWVNTEGYMFPPPGTLRGGEGYFPSARLTLLPFQLVCDWERADGLGYQTTYIELGTPLVLVAISGLAVGGSGLIVSAQKSRGKIDG